MAWTERYVRSDAAGGGDGTTDTNSGANGAWTLAEAIAAAVAGQRVNIKAGTYANTTTSRTFAGIGTTTQPLWWRGFNAAIGDLDTDFLTAKPSITFTTGRFLPTGAHQWFSNLSIVGAATTASQMAPSGGNTRFYRCRFENTGANALSRAVSTGGVGNVFAACWFKAGASATSVVQLGNNEIVLGCAFEGGGIGVDVANASDRKLIACVFMSHPSHGLLSAVNGPLEVHGCTFSACGGDGIRLTTAAPTAGSITNNVFRNCVGTAINNALGTDINTIFRGWNSYYGNGAIEAGFGDSPYFERLLETADPVVSATDLSLALAALARGSGLPGRFENESYTAYGDRGAVGSRRSGSTRIPTHGGG